MPAIAGLPTGPVPVPLGVATVAGDRAIDPVWQNVLGGVTFRLGSGPAAEYVKWAPHGAGIDLRGEIARLAWAGRYASVPTVLGQGVDDDGRWLVTAALRGSTAVAPRWQQDPRPAVVAAGVGLRALHDALPVADCPFEWSIPMRLARSGATEAAIAALGPAPEPDRTVVCHGDPCTPNTLVDDDGHWTGHVDFDTLGIADRWADIAVATMALGWNFGPGWDDVFLGAYGVDPDPDRTRWYRALWNLGDGRVSQEDLPAVV